MNAVTTHAFNAGRAGSGAMQTFAFEPVGMSVRVILRDGAPWFIAADVAKAMGYSNPSKALRDHVAPDDRSNVSLDRGGSLGVINESGLYSLIFGSKLEGAVRFKRWVTHEVLPAIRKTGSYATRGSVATLPAPTQDRVTSILMIGEAVAKVPGVKQAAIQGTQPRRLDAVVIGQDNMHKTNS